MNENNQNYLTKGMFKEGLAEFTEVVLLPAVENIVDDKVKREIGVFRTEIKDYIDVKMGDLKGEIISSQKEVIAAIKGEKEKDVKFKKEVVAVFKHNELVDHEKIGQLEALI